MRVVIAELHDLFQQFGQQHYGEKCTQLEHAIASAEHAIFLKLKEPLVIAAFVHDIGHLLADRDNLPGMTDVGHPHHSKIAANWLKKNAFPDSVIQPIRYHVCAKRYLQSQLGTHQQLLSAASLTTLAQQGGVMKAKEADDFELNLSFDDALALRACDDMGKPNHCINIDLTYWLDRVEKFYLSVRKSPNIFL